MSKSLTLSYIENNFDESLLMNASNHLRKGNVSIFEEIEKNLWLGIIADKGEAFEVEILIVGEKVKQYTCDCNNFHDQGHCPHVVAGLLQLRIQRTNVELIKAKKKALAPDQPKRLTIDTVLEVTPPEYMKSFIKAYARRDRIFSLSLKANFASFISVEDEEQKYQMLVASIISKFYRPGKKLSQSGLTKMCRLIEDLTNQLPSMIHSSKFEEAFILIRVLFCNLPGLLNPAEKKQPLILDLLIQSLSALNNIVNTSIAPGLKLKIRDFLKAEMEKPYIRKNNLLKNMLEISFPLAVEFSELGLLAGKISKIMASLSSSSPGFQVCLRIKLKILYDSNEKAALDAFIGEMINDPKNTVTLMEFFIENNDFEYAWKLGQPLLSGQHSKKLDEHLVQKLLNLALRSGKETNLVEISYLYFIQTYDFQFFSLCKKQAGAGWPDILDNMLRELLGRPSKLSRNMAIAEIYYREEQFSQFVNFVEASQSLSLVQKFASKLNQLNGFSKEIFERLITNYLNTHLGPKPAIKVKETLEILEDEIGKSLAGNLANMVKNKYPKRQALLEKLSKWL